MESRTLDITVISATDIKNVNTFSKMDVYAVVEISDDPRSKQKTHVDKESGTNPKWNFPMKFIINEDALQQNRLTLFFKLKSDRSLGDKDIGQVHVPIKELLDNNTNPKTEREASFSVRKPSGKGTKGTLTFRYKFGDTFAVQKSKNVDEPVMAYPVSYSASSSAPHYPPGPPGMGVPYQPPNGSGYPPQYPPQYGTGYGYPPPPQSGYGYPQAPMTAQKPKKNKFGMGMGLGAGLLGGLLIGDMVSDMGDMGGGYDGDFGGGFDGGFDF